MRRSDPDAFEVQSSGPPKLSHDPAVVVDVLAPLVTEERLARLQSVVAARSRAVTIVLENIDDPHNASAVLRSADAFGLQDVHVVGERSFVASRQVAKGTHRWLDVKRHLTAAECAAELHAAGYQILVASMEGQTTPAEAARLERVAFVFGNEHRGPSPEMREVADGTYGIPMRGFVESLNVSVAAAITLHVATVDRPSDLDVAARERLLARFLMASVKDSGAVLADQIAQRQDRANS